MMLPLLPNPTPESCSHCGADLASDSNGICVDCQNRSDRSEVESSTSIDVLEDKPPRLWERIARLFGYGDCILYNRTGYLILLISFLPLALYSVYLRDIPEGKGLVIGGLSVCVFDFVFRLASSDFHLFQFHPGGRFLFLPMWIMGVFWIVLGLRG